MRSTAFKVWQSSDLEGKSSDERLSPDFTRGRGKSIGEDVNVDDEDYE
jgi:hypothetical protein